MKYLALAAAAFLSACGGTSPSSFDFSGIPSVRTHDDVFNEGVRLAQVASALDPTPPLAAALQGSAAYEGVIAIETRTVSSVLDRLDGDFSLSVNFDNNTVVGQADEFYAQDTGRRTSGFLVFSNGTILKGDDNALLSADFSGNLMLSDEVRDVEGAIFGLFAGENGQLLSGNLAGSYEVDPVPGTILEELNITTSRFSGGFVTERISDR